jgi:hypothetical protein
LPSCCHGLLVVCCCCCCCCCFVWCKLRRLSHT